jgi:hypothetical protein
MRYLAPARYDQIIRIHTELTEKTRASLSFRYEITNQDATSLLARGMTQHAVVNATENPSASGMARCHVRLAVIVCHAHVFPPKVRSQTRDRHRGRIQSCPGGDGSVLDLLEKLDRAGLGRAICTPQPSGRTK